MSATLCSLHPQLVADSGTIGRTQLCELLMYNHQQIPWFILVPRRANVQEIFQLDVHDQRQLAEESSALGRRIMQIFNGDKLNTGAIGNLVPQLHIHHVVRFHSDSVWPQPVWGNIEPHPYSASELQQQCNLMKTRLVDLLI